MRPISKPGRLVKVLLPAALVEAMDDLIVASRAYADRNQFVTDALHGHIAEIVAAAGLEVSRSPGASDAPFGGARAGGPAGDTSQPIAEIPPLGGGVSTISGSPERPSQPTWGMHNRDYPTLWALWHLAEAVRRENEPVEYSGFLSDVLAGAWELPRRLPGERFDTSGFPANDAKRKTSEGRFVRFFLGEAAGEGPLFSLGLAGAEAGRAAPTSAGVGLLQALQGFGCNRQRGVKRSWTEAYLRHLQRYVPADLRFLQEILKHIQSGNDDRAELLQAVTADHADWSSSVVDTNLAGFVARAREWGLIAPKQRKGRYLLVDDAVSLVVTAAEDEGPNMRGDER